MVEQNAVVYLLVNQPSHARGAESVAERRLRVSGDVLLDLVPVAVVVRYLCPRGGPF